MSTHHRYDVGDAVARVDDDARERALAHLPLGPAGGQRQHRLHRDVQPGDVEGLEHDLGRVLAVLRRVEWGLRQKEVVVLGLRAQVLEDALLHELLHQVPVLHHAVTHRVLKREQA